MQETGEKEDPEQLRFLIRELAKLTEGYLKKNQQEVVRCLYTNRFAGEMRDYTVKDHGPGDEVIAGEADEVGILN